MNIISTVLQIALIGALLLISARLEKIGRRCGSARRVTPQQPMRSDESDAEKRDLEPYITAILTYAGKAGSRERR